MAVSPYVTGQLLPDVLLAPAFQDAIAKSRTSQFTGLGGLSAPKHQRASQVLTEYGQAQLLKTPQYAAARDFALRSSGINPAETKRGQQVVSFGGKAYLNPEQNRIGSFKGDPSELAKSFQKLRQYDALLAKYKQERPQQDPSQSGSFAQLSPLAGAGKRNFQDFMRQHGLDSEVSAQQRGQIVKDLAGLTEDQRNQFLADVGVDAGTFRQYEREYLDRLTPGSAGRSQNQIQVQGYRAGNEAVDEARAAVRGTVGQAQAVRGTFSGRAAAAAEGAAVGQFDALRQSQISSTLLSSALDPDRLQSGGGQSYLSETGAGAIEQALQDYQLPAGYKPTLQNRNLDYTAVVAPLLKTLDPLAVLGGYDANAGFNFRG